jgi:hypothetical protein
VHRLNPQGQRISVLLGDKEIVITNKIIFNKRISIPSGAIKRNQILKVETFELKFNSFGAIKRCCSRTGNELDRSSIPSGAIKI